MEKLTFANPVFAAYAGAAALMILKTTLMAWLTVFQMMRHKAGYRAPEDAKKTPLNPNPTAGQTGPDERVDRFRRIHWNDLENVPFFLVAGLLYVLTDPATGLAQTLFWGYALSRLLHFAAYASGQIHDIRATFWTIGVLIVMFMATRVLLVALGF